MRKYIDIINENENQNHIFYLQDRIAELNNELEDSYSEERNSEIEEEIANLRTTLRDLENEMGDDLEGLRGYRGGPG